MGNKQENYRLSLTMGYRIEENKLTSGCQNGSHLYWNNPLNNNNKNIP